MKKCFKCNKKKELSEFYRHPRMGDGYLGKCKECTKKDTLLSRSENLEYYREYDRKRANLPHRVKLRKKVAEKWKKDPKLRKITNERSKEWREKNVVKRAAHILIGNAVRAGKILPQPCEICGKKKAEAHHDDYSKPMAVRWLCHKHHMEYHKNEREEKRISNQPTGEIT